MARHNVPAHYTAHPFTTTHAMTLKPFVPRRCVEVARSCAERVV